MLSTSCLKDSADDVEEENNVEEEEATERSFVAVRDTLRERMIIPTTHGLL